MTERETTRLGPHVALIVRRLPRDGGWELDYTLDSDDPGLGFVHRRFGSQFIEGNPVAKLQSFLRKLGDRPIQSERQQRDAVLNLQATGAWLFEKLLPADLRDVVRSLIGRAESLEIISEETTIPWEVMCPPRRPEDDAVGPFLGEAFVVTRWLSEARPVVDLPLRRMAIVVAGDSELASAEEEKQRLMARARDDVRAVEEVPSRYSEVVEALGSGTYDGWHFIGHGAASGTNADEWQIELRRHEPLSAFELLAEARGLGRSAPLVFLNACETGQGGSSLTGIGGWASSFLGAGAGAFIGPLWPVRDGRACAFAGDFYDAFLTGVPIGVALRQARLAYRERFPGDPTWLAYVVYARPQASCKSALAEGLPVEKALGSALSVSPSSPFARFGFPRGHVSEGEPVGGSGAASQAETVRFAGTTSAASDRGRGGRATVAEPARPSTPRPGEQRLHDPDGSLLLYVPGGEYTLGADDINDWTRPVHRVHLAPFWIARHPVTNEQYGRFLAAHPGAAPPEFWQDERFNTSQQPVVGVSWEDAEAYCRWVGLALPSEAQWEAAARGTEGRTYPWGDEPPEPRHANFGGRLGATSPVDAHPDGAGPFGTLDQAGNVWEWCADSWSLTAYRQRGEGAWNPVTRGDTSMRVLRGGSWVNPGRDLRAAYRDRATARLRFNTQGFRCVLPVEGY